MQNPQYETTIRALGKEQRRLLSVLSNIHCAMVVGDKLSASLVSRGLLAAEADGRFARITPAGLRRLADEIDADRIRGWSPENVK